MGPITDEHKLSYKMNVALVAQQTRSRLEMAFTFQDSLKGRQMQMLDLIGTTTAIRNAGRKADTPDIDNPTEPIWVTPEQVLWGKIMEVEDTIKAVMNHQSSFIQSGTAAVVRMGDTIRSERVFGTRRIGQDGVTVQAWAGDTVAVGVGSLDGATPTGMNVAKIIRARRLLQQRQVDLGAEELFLGTNAQGIEELFGDLVYISDQYRNRKVLDQPERVDILNVTILPPLDGAPMFTDFDGSTFTNGLWCRSAMHWGDFEALRADIPLRPDKLNRPHPHTEWWLGASRSEDFKVVKILNNK